MDDKKWKFCLNLAAKISTVVMLNSDLIEDEGALKVKVRSILAAMGMGVIRSVGQSRKHILDVTYLHRGQIKSARLVDKVLYNERTNHADVDAIEYIIEDDDVAIEREKDSLLQLELKIGSFRPHNNRWPTAKGGYVKDLRRIVDGSVHAFIGVVDETFYRAMTGDDIRAGKNRRRGKKEKITLSNLFPPMGQLIKQSTSPNPVQFNGEWMDHDTKQVHKLRCVCLATKHIGLESPPLYDTTIAQAPIHDHDAGKHSCGLCSKYDLPGQGVTKGAISYHRKRHHGEENKIDSYAEHKVVFVIGLPPENEGRAF